jgi:hypothetical protein
MDPGKKKYLNLRLAPQKNVKYRFEPAFFSLKFGWGRVASWGGFTGF